MGVHVTNQPCNESLKCLEHSECCGLVSCPHGHSLMAAHTEHAGVNSQWLLFCTWESQDQSEGREQGPAQRDGCWVFLLGGGLLRALPRS